MASRRRSVSLFALFLVAAPAALFAQSNTTSALGGTVRDPAGNPLAGALIRVSSPSLIGGERTAASSENGSYRIPGLPPGRYHIVVEHKGLPVLTGSELLVLGRTATVNWKFAATASATVEVVATAADLDTAPVGLTQNYDTTALAELPVDRTMTAIMSMTPGVNYSAYSGGTNAWGGGTVDNAWLMDGVNIGDPAGNSQWLYANPDWFSEVQVGGVGAGAEYGNFNGAYTNALIKRGGNTFEGSFNLYYADSKWESQSHNNYPGLDLTLNPAKSYDAAVNLGGPIIKDRLWFFISAWSRQQQTTPIGSLATDTRKYENFLGKFTFQATPSATLEVLVEYDGTFEQNRGIDNTQMPIATSHEVAPDRLFSLNWTQTLASNLVLTAKVSGYTGNYERRPYNGEAPSLDTEDVLSTNGIEYYNNNAWYRNDYRSRIEGVATLDWFKTGLLTPGDSHAFKFGLEQGQSSTVEIERATAGVQLQAYEDSATAGWVDPDVFTTGGGYNAAIRSNRTALYAQDTWTINDRLTLRPGLRYERYQANGYGGPTLWDKKVLAPRIGGTLALTADQANLLKFHWGRYYAAFSAYFVDRTYLNWEPDQNTYYWGSTTVFNPLDPSTYPAANPNDPSNTLASVSRTVAPVDPNAKQPYTDETTFSYEHKFKGPWSATATWVYRTMKDILVNKDLSDVTSGANPTGSYISDTYTDWKNDPSGITQSPYTYWQSTVDPATQSWINTTDSSAKRNFVMATLTVDRKYQDGWSLNGSFTRSIRYGNMDSGDSYDTWNPYQSPNYLVNSYGLLPGYNDYEVKARGMVDLPWTLRLSVNYTYLSGQRFTPYVRSPRDPIYGLRTYEYIEPRGSEKYPGNQQWDMRLIKNLKFSDKSSLEVFAQVFNALNTGTTFSYASERANSSAYGTPNLTQEGRRLQLGVRYAF